MDWKQSCVAHSPPDRRRRSRVHRTWVAVFLAIGLAAVLGSCGGGGGDSNNPPAAGPPLTWDSPQATWDNVTWQ